MTYLRRAEPISVSDARNGRVCEACTTWAPGRMVVKRGDHWYCRDHAPMYSDQEMAQIFAEVKQKLSAT